MRRSPSPISAECYRYLAQWMGDRVACKAFPDRFGKTEDQPSGTGGQAVSARAVVAGQQEQLS